MEDLQAGNEMKSIFNFSSEMELGNISPPLIKRQLRNSKILKNFITLRRIHIPLYLYL